MDSDRIRIPKSDIRAPLSGMASCTYRKILTNSLSEKFSFNTLILRYSVSDVTGLFILRFECNRGP